MIEFSARKIQLARLEDADTMTMYTVFARWTHGLVALLSFSVISIFAAQETTQAQAKDPYDLSIRLDALEEQIFELKQETGSRPARRLQPQKFGGNASSAAALSLRISEIEGQMRALNGRVEEMNFSMRRLTEKFSKFSEDVEFRFQELKKSGTVRRKQQPSKISRRSRSTKSLGTISVRPKPKPRQSTGSARGDYDRAYGMLKKRRYGDAEVGFKGFLKRYPKNALSGNAQYWMGETYFRRSQYKKSADAFLRGYTRYRSSAKAPDSLLKLGITLARLKQKDAACSAFDEMGIEFPRASRKMRDKVRVERRRVGC